MNLFILAQDIRELELGLVEDGELTQTVSLEASPEQHLKSIADHLAQWGTSLDELEGVYVVTGPGSFTASRVSITIANALAFSKNIPIYPIENKERRTMVELHKHLKEHPVSSTPFALPSYDRPPMTTTPKSHGDKVLGANK